MKRIRKVEVEQAPVAPVEPERNEVAEAIERSAEATRQAAEETAQTMRELAAKMQPSERPKAFRCTVVERDEKGRIKSFDIEAR